MDAASPAPNFPRGDGKIRQADPFSMQIRSRISDFHGKQL
jgi:hypothetical protein